MVTIYLSSTYADFEQHRESVYRILRRLRHDVVAMEDYVATDHRPLQQCLADVEAADIYVGLIGWRYGYQPEQDNPERRSITELEYRQAGDSGLPRLMFLADPGVDWPDLYKDAETGDGDAGQRIEAFRAELETDKLVSHFRSPDHLAGLVSVAVQRCLQERTAASLQGQSKTHGVKVKTLNQQLADLLEDYQAETEELSSTDRQVARNRIRRRIEALEKEIDEVAEKVERLTHEASQTSEWLSPPHHQFLQGFFQSLTETLTAQLPAWCRDAAPHQMRARILAFADASDALVWLVDQGHLSRGGVPLLSVLARLSSALTSGDMRRELDTCRKAIAVAAGVSDVGLSTAPEAVVAVRVEIWSVAPSGRQYHVETALCYADETLPRVKDVREQQDGLNLHNPEAVNDLVSGLREILGRHCDGG